MKCNLLKVLSFSIMASLYLNTRVVAQEVLDTSNFYTIKQRLMKELEASNPAEEEKEDSKSAQFYRWEWLWSSRLGANGNMNTANEVMTKYLDNLEDGDLTLCDSPYDNNIDWTNLGPSNSKGAFPAGGCKSVADKQNQGRIECISVNPNDVNDIVVGSWNSGSWRTTDGGKSWVNTTDDEGLSFLGVRSMVRHPMNANIIYATTGIESGLWDGDFRYLYSVGIIMSIDGGVSWIRKSTIGNAHVLSEDWNCHKIAIDPNSTLNQ